MRRVLSIFTLITILALVMTACTGEQASSDVSQEEEVAAEAATETPQAFAETPSPVPTETPTEPSATDEVNTVQVSLTEFTIDMPTTLPPGPTTFEIENAGSFRHNFEIEGQGIEEVLAADLQAGESDTLEVDLEPGTYQVICPVSDHAGEGMNLELTVSQSSAKGPAEKTNLAGAT